MKVEAIDSLPLPMDTETIVKSVQKTKRLRPDQSYTQPWRRGHRAGGENDGVGTNALPSRRAAAGRS
jgi:hypothetical protein